MPPIPPAANPAGAVLSCTKVQAFMLALLCVLLFTFGLARMLGMDLSLP